MLRYLARRAFPVIAWSFLVALGVQIFFAGMYVFVGPSSIALHLNFAHVIGVLSFALIATAFAGGVAGGDKRATLVIFGLLLVQGGLIIVSKLLDLPLLAALHPVNAMVMTWAALALARRSSVYWSRPSEQPAAMGAPMAEPTAA